MAFSFEFAADFIREGTWDLQLLRAFFHPLLVQKISAIYLPQHWTEDSWIWAASRHGHLSSKVAYHYIRDLSFDRDPPDVRWQNIWRLGVPPRIQTFLWKLAWGRLPTGAFVARQRPGAAPPCPACRAGPDDAEHIFFLCRHARMYWQDASHRLGLPLLPSTRWAVADWSSVAASVPPDSLPALTAFIAQSLWGLWKRRNIAFFQGRVESNLSIFCRAAAATRESFHSPGGGPPPSGHWEAHSSLPSAVDSIDPSSPYAICDAAWDGASLRSGSGFLIYSQGSDIIQGQWRGLAHSALQAELLCIRQCLQQAALCGIPSIQLATDCQVAVKLLRRDYRPMWAVRGLLEDIWESAAHLQSVIWIHLPRQDTATAHAAARGALELEDFELLICRLPVSAGGHVFSFFFPLYQPVPGLQPPGRSCVPHQAVVHFP